MEGVRDEDGGVWLYVLVFWGALLCSVMPALSSSVCQEEEERWLVRAAAPAVVM